MAEGYANPNALVTTAWVAEHAADPSVRVLESNEDVLLYDVGHVPGAQKIDWQADLNDPVSRDFIGPEGYGWQVYTDPVGHPFCLCRNKGVTWP